MNNPVNREFKNSVFIDLFGQEVFRMQLFRTLHPEIQDVTDADLKTITLKQVITAETEDIKKLVPVTMNVVHKSHILCIGALNPGIIGKNYIIVQSNWHIPE